MVRAGLVLCVLCLATTCRLVLTYGPLHGTGRIVTDGPTAAAPFSDVVYWKQSPQTSVHGNKKCYINKMEDQSIFQSCWSGVETPIQKATCCCKDPSCLIKVNLICNKDEGRWYAENKVDTRGCNQVKDYEIQHCDTKDIPKDLICKDNKSRGNFGETRESICRHNCHQITIKCYSDGRWHPSGPEDCRNFNEYEDYNPQEHLHLKFQNGKFTFTCDAGFELDENRPVKCNDGTFEGDFPACIQAFPELHTTPGTFKTITPTTYPGKSFRETQEPMHPASLPDNPNQAIRPKHPDNTQIFQPSLPTDYSSQSTYHDKKQKTNWLWIGLGIFFVLLIIIIIAFLVWFKCFYKKRSRSITPIVGFSSQVNKAFEEPPFAAEKDMMKDNDMYVPACSVSTLAKSSDKTKGNVTECMKVNDIYVSSDVVSTSLNNMSK